MISFKPFRTLTAERWITTCYLRNKCGRYNLDSKTIDRLMRDESVSTNTVDALCQIFGCAVTDIMQVAPDPENDTWKNA